MKKSKCILRKAKKFGKMNIKVENLEEALTIDFVNLCCTELDIKPDSIEVVGTAYLADMAGAARRTGLCIDLDEKNYMVIAAIKDRTLTEIYTTIAHEIVHIKQYMKEDLGKLLDSEKPIYEDRWWEKEAREKSLVFVKKFVDILERIR
jgi:hypothetical protein